MPGQLQERVSKLKAAAVEGKSGVVRLDHKAFLDVTEGLSYLARQRLSRSCTMADCCLVTADGRCFVAHRAGLAEQCGVFRTMFADLPDATDFDLSETSKEIAPLLNFLYAPEENLYNIPDLTALCDAQLAAESNLVDFPAFFTFVAEYDLTASVKACESYACDALPVLIRTHGSAWLDKLPAASLSLIVARAAATAEALAQTLCASQNGMVWTLANMTDRQGYPHVARSHANSDCNALLSDLRGRTTRQLRATEAMLTEKHVPPALRQACRPVVAMPSRPQR